MIIHIDKKERDAVARCCAETGIPYEFFTMENKPGMLAAQIEIEDPKTIWALARLVQVEIECIVRKELERKEDELQTLLQANKEIKKGD